MSIEYFALLLMIIFGAFFVYGIFWLEKVFEEDSKSEKPL